MNHFDSFQMFGRAKSATSDISVMLCRDVDAPDEVTLHFFGPDTTPGGAVCRVERSGKSLTLRPRLFLAVREDGKTLYVPPNLTPEQIRFRDETYATLVEKDDGLVGEWRGVDGFGGQLELSSRLPMSELNLDVEELASWSEFKSWVARVRREFDACSFRGHGSNTFTLKTALHRAGLHRIERFCAGRLVEFRSHAEAVLNEKFNMNDGQDYGTVLGLAQHHGLPTPMLDWTGSPYVAAFFAFSDAVQEQASRTEVKSVRVFALSKWFVENNSPPSVVLPQLQPYVECLQISARINPRLYAQRGQFLVTNVANLESLLLAIEHAAGKPLLRCVDIPIACASEALEDLEFMGISAAALFPGLDGVCRMMRNQIMYRGNGSISQSVGVIPVPESQVGGLGDGPDHETNQGVLSGEPAMRDAEKPQVTSKHETRKPRKSSRKAQKNGTKT